MSILRGIRKVASGPGAALGGVLTSTAVYGPDGFLDVENISLSRDRAMKLSTVNRCVEVRSCTIAALPVYLMRESTKERLRDYRLAGVLWGRPNEAMTRFDYERLMQVNLDLRGNAYAWINRDNKTGYPVELIPLQPDHVTPYVALDSSLWYIYTNPRTGQMFRLSPADVLHYKAYSLDGIEGISILHRAALTIQTGLAAQEYQRAMYQNGGRPSGVLTTESDIGGNTTVKSSDGSTVEISKKEFIRREWEKIHAGPGNGFRVAVMDNGLKYQPISVSNSDAQFVESEEIRVSDVCRFFGTPAAHGVRRETGLLLQRTERHRVHPLHPPAPGHPAGAGGQLQAAPPPGADRRIADPAGAEGPAAGRHGGPDRAVQGDAGGRRIQRQ